MQKDKPPATPAEITDPDLQFVQESAAYNALLEKCADFALRQAEALSGIGEMARVLTLNEGLAKDRARVAAMLQLFSEECATEVRAHIGLLAAISALQQEATTDEDDIRHPWPFMVSLDIH